MPRLSLTEHELIVLYSVANEEYGRAKVADVGYHANFPARLEDFKALERVLYKLAKLRGVEVRHER